jgi:hypothetical protein
MNILTHTQTEYIYDIYYMNWIVPELNLLYFTIILKWLLCKNTGTLMPLLNKR